MLQNQHNRSVQAIGTAFALLFFALPWATASNKTIELNSAKVQDKSPNGMVVFGHIQPSAPQIGILAEDAAITVIRDKNASEITVASNCPHNWNLQGSLVRQAGFANPRKGVAMMGDALGSRAICNGRIYALPTGQMHGLKMGPDGVFVGDKKLEPIQGTDMPGTCQGPDAVEVRVPDTYSGNLLLGCGQKSSINIASWTGGLLQCTLLGDSQLSAGKLKSLAKTVVDVRGAGKAVIADLSTKVLVANIDGTGSLSVTHGSAEISNATVAGTGQINLKGVYKGLKKQVSGTGTINIGK